MRPTKTSLAFATLLAINIGFVRAEEQPAMIQFVRPLGMGGAFTAIADDHNIFNFNPAGMVQRTGAQVTLLEIAAGGSQDLKKAYDYIDKHQDELTHFEDLTPQQQSDLTNEIADTISKLDPRAYIAADVASFVSGPKFFWLPVHVGFGAFGVVDAKFADNSDAGRKHTSTKGCVGSSASGAATAPSRGCSSNASMRRHSAAAVSRSATACPW
jgi:hypothetical protein